MSSEDEEPARKRRAQRACDVCRRKKIRCKESQTEDSRCLHCSTFNLKCSYHVPNTQYVPPKSYLLYLESRLEKAEALLRKLHPDTDFSRELGPRFARSSWSQDNAAAMSTPSHTSAESFPAKLPPLASTAVLSHSALYRENEDGDLDSSDEDETPGGRGLEAHLRSMHLHPMHARYHGKSSGAKLILSAMSVKSELAGRSPVSRNEPPSQNQKAVLPGLSDLRPEYWQVHEWEKTQLNACTAGAVNAACPLSEQGHPSVPATNLSSTRPTFPPEDLISKLIDAYFIHVNVAAPLLHRPSFERSVASGAHLHVGFGEVLLLVCAVGARFVDDERVLLDGVSKHSAGWQWFNQVQSMNRSIFKVPCLHDLQICCLRVMFLSGSTALWHASWSILGAGVRLAQDVGVHRRKVYSEKPTVHDELWRRAFWVLVTFDRHLSSVFGKPCSIQDEDFDVGLPTDCDDEYWENDDPDLAFKQPPGKPSKVAFFISLIRQQEILAFALRTIYSINRSKVMLGFVGQEWEQRVVSQLDSALNQWVDSVPDHLRWDPDREDPIFFKQSALLYVAYYMLQITVHRPFISNRRDSANPRAGAGFPSLAICTNAARACAKVVHTLPARFKHVNPEPLPAAFNCGVVLLLSIWSGRRSGAMVDPTREMADVYKCMDVLRAFEKQWQSAGCMWDTLAHLASASSMPISEPVRGTAQKRTREPEPAPAMDTSASFMSTGAPEPQTMSGNQPAPVPAAGGPTFGLPHALDPATSSGMFALGLRASASAPPGGWVALEPPLSYGGRLGEHAIDDSALVGAGASTYAPLSGNTGEPLTESWPYADLAAAACYPPCPEGAEGADLDTIGTALDALLSRSGTGLAGNDPLATWTQTPMNFESTDWSQYLFGMGSEPSQPHSE